MTIRLLFGISLLVAFAAPNLIAQAPPERIRVGGNVQAANLIKKVTPVYPPLAKQARVQGTVRFTVIISKEGKIINIQLVAGHPLLVPSATEAVQQWEYKPTLLNGNPVEVITQIDVNYTLSDDYDWAVNWAFLSKFRQSGEDLPNGAMPANTKLNANGQLRNAEGKASEWRFSELRLDGEDSPIEPMVFFTRRQPNMDLPDLYANWKAMAARLISQRKPVKPREDLQGSVALDCVINRDGAVEKILTVKGPEELTKAASEAVRDWKFRPVSINGEFYAVRTTIVVEF